MQLCCKNILTTFYSGNESALTTISCEVTEFLQQSSFFSRSQYFTPGPADASLLLAIDSPHRRQSASSPPQRVTLFPYHRDKLSRLALRPELNECHFYCGSWSLAEGGNMAPILPRSLY